ncbi:hypothetical protein SAMN02745751_03723 [Dethiosulfatibacter aminovorans DSM 17477]|uniref:Uncharacterized protein n=1 Tax=Dethiosulfatibacter aminovorans DSM 17477 TaxID=1121476 RepID=A0A1M6NAT2_9FIRM|nr:hypothetical protein [Dethiosulfatibacter aminovorans]SHJ92819.1 hypothetical protein SAMN02745751_03723 [Dethiosulfatibacter aminovorans DSM 17477]
MKKNDYVNKRKITTRVILITVYTTFICYLLGKLQSISDWNYNVHEMLYLPYNFAIFALPIEVFVWIYYSINVMKEERDKVDLNVKTLMINMVSFASVIIIVIFFYIQTFSVSTGCILEVGSKFREGNDFYIELMGKKIVCSQNEYNLITEGEVYSIEYTWNEKWPGKGRLEYIEIIEN